MKKNLAIMLFSDRKYMFALGTFIINIKQFVKNYDSILIYNSDFSSEDEQNINKIDDKCIFIKYTFDDFIEEFNFDKDQIKNLDAIKRYSHISPVKFKMFTHLNEYKTIILFDTDMLLLSDINDILNDNYNIAWRDEQLISEKLTRSGYSIDKIKKIGLLDTYSKATTPNGGFIIINDNFDYMLAYNTAFNYFKKYFLIHPFLMGEITLGYVRFILNLNLFPVDHNIYNAFPNMINLKTKLIHFLGNYKPWNRQFIQYIYCQWIYNYIEYTMITGHKDSQVKIFDNIGEDFILKENNKEKWNKIFNINKFIYPSELKPRLDFEQKYFIFDYNDYLYYEILSPSWLFESYCCRMWIRGSYVCNNTILIEKINEIIKKNERFLNKLSNKNGFGCESLYTDIRNIQENFNWLYIVTSDIRSFFHTFNRG